MSVSRSTKNYSTFEDRPKDAMLPIVQQRANEVANNLNDKANLTSTDRAKLESQRQCLVQYVNNWNASHKRPEDQLKVSPEVESSDGQYKISIERKVPALMASVPTRQAGAQASEAPSFAYPSYSRSTYEQDTTRRQTESTKSVFETVALESMQSTSYAKGFKVDKPSTQELADFQAGSIIEQLLYNTGFSAKELSKLSNEEQERFAMDVREITITGLATMEILKTGKNDKDYKYQLDNNIKVANERAQIGVERLRLALVRELGEKIAGLITVKVSDTPKIRYIDTLEEFDMFIRHLSDQPGGSAQVQKWLTDGVIRSVAGSYLPNKPDEFNRQMKRTNLGGIRNESKPNDPIVLALSDFRGIQATTSSPLGLEISIERAGASGTAAAIPAEAGKPLVFDVKLFQLHHDKSRTVANNTVSFEDVRVFDFQGAEMHELTSDKYAVDPVKKTITVLNPVAGMRYTVQAAAVKRVEGAELQRTRDAMASADTFGVKYEPEARVPYMRKAPALAALVRKNEKVVMTEEITTLIWALHSDVQSQFDGFFPGGHDQAVHFFNLWSQSQFADVANILSDQQVRQFWNAMPHDWIFTPTGSLDALISHLNDTAMYNSNRQGWYDKYYTIVQRGSLFDQVLTPSLDHHTERITTEDTRLLSRVVSRMVYGGAGITHVFANKPLSEFKIGTPYSLTIVTNASMTQMTAYLNDKDQTPIKLPKDWGTDVGAIITLVGPLETLIDIGSTAQLGTKAQKINSKDLFIKDATYSFDISRQFKLSERVFATISGGAVFKGEMDKNTGWKPVANPGWRATWGADLGYRIPLTQTSNLLLSAGVTADYMVRQAGIFTAEPDISSRAGATLNVGRFSFGVQGGTSDTKFRNYNVGGTVAVRLGGRKPGATYPANEPALGQTVVFGFAGTGQVSQDFAKPEQGGEAPASPAKRQKYVPAEQRK
jgi:hypothetical protein